MSVRRLVRIGRPRRGTRTREQEEAARRFQEFDHPGESYGVGRKAGPTQQAVAAALGSVSSFCGRRRQRPEPEGAETAAAAAATGAARLRRSAYRRAGHQHHEDVPGHGGRRAPGLVRPGMGTVPMFRPAHMSVSWVSTASEASRSEQEDGASSITISELDASRISHHLLEDESDDSWLVHWCDHEEAIQRFVDRLKAAAEWRRVDPEFTASAEEEGELVPLTLSLSNSSPPSSSPAWDADLCRTLARQYDAYLRSADADIRRVGHPQLLRSDTVALALKVLTKTRSHRDELAARLRSWERILGGLRRTELTDHLSLRLLTINAKSGQVGRVLALLKLRADKGYEPRAREFPLAIRAIRIAQRLHRERNLFVGDSEMSASTWSWNSPTARSMLGSTSSSAATVPMPSPSTLAASTTATAPASMLLPLDNPTRWLDAILLNMKARSVPLTPSLASQMLWCYSSGYTGKATHHFYRVKRRPVVGPAAKECKEGDSTAQHQGGGMPVQTLWDREERKYVPRVTKVQIEYNTCTPPFYKVPSLVGRQSLQYHHGHPQHKSPSSPRTQPLSLAESPTLSDGNVAGAPVPTGRTKLEMEQDPSYSPALNAAFEFATSVELGAAGHDPVELNNMCVNALVSACVSRGALWRAMQLVEDSSSSGTPAAVSIATYNLLLVGLARVGDVRTMQEVTGQLLSAGHRPNSGTVRAVVTGLLNLGDVGSAITVVQDSFNQHSVLPPVSTLLTILEHCLAGDVAFEAKRCLSFIQQLWKFHPNPYHPPGFAAFMARVQAHPQLQRPALERLFSYFGHDLHDSDFF